VTIISILILRYLHRPGVRRPTPRPRACEVMLSSPSPSRAHPPTRWAFAASAPTTAGSSATRATARLRR
jgi:hypothetical protein